MARKIVITSGKGGVGKTTICANLGFALASKGFRVMLLDVDIGLNNLDVASGIENKVIYDIVDVIEGKCRARQALVQHPTFPSLHILPSAHSYNVGKVDGNSLKGVVDELSDSFDYVLIDCPAGIDVGFHRAVFCADEAIIVTTPHISAVRDANKVASILNSYYLSNISLIVNRARGDLVVSNAMIKEQDIAKSLNLPLIGVIPESDEISCFASIYGDVFAVDGEAYKSFKILAENVHGGSLFQFDYTKKYKGIIGKIRRTLKRRM